MQQIGKLFNHRCSVANELIVVQISTKFCGSPNMEAVWTVNFGNSVTYNLSLLQGYRCLQGFTVLPTLRVQSGRSNYLLQVPARFHGTPNIESADRKIKLFTIGAGSTVLPTLGAMWQTILFYYRRLQGFTVLPTLKAVWQTNLFYYV